MGLLPRPWCSDRPRTERSLARRATDVHRAGPSVTVLALIFATGCVTAPRREYPRSASLFVYVQIVAPSHPRPPAGRLDGILPQGRPRYDAFSVSIMPAFDSDLPGTLTVYVTAVGTEYRFTNAEPLTRGRQLRLLGMDSIDEPVPAFHIGGVRAQHDDHGLSPLMNFDCEEVEEWDGLAYACHVDVEDLRDRGIEARTVSPDTVR